MAFLDFFRKKEDENKTVRLVSGTEMLVMVNRFSSLKKDELLVMALGLANYTRKAEFKCTSDSEKDLVEIYNTALRGIGSFNKPELVKFLASLLSDFRNVYNITMEVCPEFIPVWKAMVMTNEIKGNEVQDIAVGEKLRLNPTVSKAGKKKITDVRYYSDPLLNMCHSESSAHSYWGSRGNGHWVKFSVSANMRRQMISILFSPDFDKSICRRILPEEENLVTVSYRSCSAKAMEYLSMLVLTDVISVDDGKPTASVMKKVVAGLEFPRFAIEDIDKAYANWPEYVMSRSYISYCRYLTSNFKLGIGLEKGVHYDRDEKFFSRYITDSYLREFDVYDFRVFMPNLKGLSKRMVNFNNVRNIIRAMLDILGRGANDSWLDVGNLWYLYISNVQPGHSEFIRLFNIGYYSGFRLDDIVEEKEVSLDAQTMSLVKPFVYQFIGFMAVWGLIELAFTPPVEGVECGKVSDFWDRLRYVRLTPLGLYALGKTDVYESESKDVNNVEQFDIDSENGIVTVLDDNSPYALFLSKIGDRITPNRYKVTASSLVANSSGKNGLETNITSFVNYICGGECDDIWKNVFEEARIRTKPFIDVKSEYKLFKLDPKVPGLVDYICSEKEFGRNVIKADGFHLLVLSDYEHEFKQSLKKAGYMA